MRIDQKLAAIRAASDGSSQLRLEATDFYGGQAYRVENWATLSVALKVLLEQGWPRERWPGEMRWLDDFIELNSAEDRPLLDINQFNTLQQIVQMLSEMLPVVIGVFRPNCGNTPLNNFRRYWENTDLGRT